MIGADWLNRILLLAHVDRPPRQPNELAQLLEQPEEVLPFVLGAGGFADWTETKAALAKAVAGVPVASPRSSAARHECSGWTYSPEREALIVQMHAMVLSAGPGQPPAGSDRPDAEELAQLIHRQRREHGQHRGPASFIGGVFAGEHTRDAPPPIAIADGGQETIAALLRLQSGRPIWWRMMPREWRHNSLRRLAKRRGLFDGEAYLARNPDVAAAGMDPLKHYIYHGCIEGRAW